MNKRRMEKGEFVQKIRTFVQKIRTREENAK